MDSNLDKQLKELQKLGVSVGKDMTKLVTKLSEVKSALSPEQRAEVEKAEKEAGVMDEALEQLKNTNLDFSKWA